MKTKVLIIGPSFFGYNHSIRRAFDALGYQTKVKEYDEPIHPFSWKNKILRKFFPRSKWLRNKSRRLFNSSIIEEFTTYCPNLVFIYNGDILEKETIRLFKQNSKVAIWMLDGAFLHPDSVAIASEVDVYFCFEKSDVNKLTALGVNAYFLPQGYDPEVYYPVRLPGDKDIDVLFVGAVYGYTERIRLLKLLIKELGNKYKIRIYGRYKPFDKNPLKWLFREKRDVFINKNISPEEVNRLYNKAKVCINIHHAQSIEGANPKVFEICGAGAFQVVDYNNFIAGVYANHEVGLYRSDKEFISVIEAALNTDISSRAHSAYQKVLAEHTFECRIREALNVLSLVRIKRLSV